MRIAIFIVIFLSGLVQACDLDNVDSLSKKIESGLAVGASKTEVELFLEKSSWLYDYNRFTNRFQATPPDDTAECKGRNFLLWAFYDCGIQIYINLNESGKYRDYTVEQIYSGL